MARSKPITIKVPQAVADAVEAHLKANTFGRYPSRNALLVGIITYAALFPVAHTVTAAIARLPEEDQDKIHDLILHAAQTGRSLADELPKPATAEALLYLAQRL